MYAYIKIINGINRNKQKIVPISRLLHFKKDVHKQNVKYNVIPENKNDPEEACIVCFLAETKQDLETLIRERASKRSRAPTTKLLKSASSGLSEDSSASKNVKEMSKNTKPVSTSLKGAALKDHVRAKLDQFKSNEFSSPTVTTSGLNLQSCSTKNSLKKDKFNGNEEKQIADMSKEACHKTVTNSVFEPRLKNNKSNTTQNKAIDPLQLRGTKGKCAALNVNLDKSNVNDAAEPQLKKVKVDGKIQTKTADPFIRKSFTSTSTPQIKNVTSVHPSAECDKKITILKNNIDHLTKKLNVQNDKLKELEKENKYLLEQKQLYKKKYSDKQEEHKTLTKLNHDLQTHVIEAMKEKEEMMRNIANAENAIQIRHNYPSIGSLRTSNNNRRYHIGRDQWLNEVQYNGLLNSSKTPSILAGNLITLIFSMDELANGTITGFKSRRAGKGKISCEKLDPVRLGACEDFYIYWIDHVYIPEPQDVIKIASDATKFYYYARSKIAELKRPKEVLNTKLKKNKLKLEFRKKHIGKNRKINDVAEETDEVDEKSNDSNEEIPTDSETEKTEEEKLSDGEIEKEALTDQSNDKEVFDKNKDESLNNREDNKKNMNDYNYYEEIITEEGKDEKGIDKELIEQIISEDDELKSSNNEGEEIEENENFDIDPLFIDTDRISEASSPISNSTLKDSSDYD